MLTYSDEVDEEQDSYEADIEQWKYEDLGHVHLCWYRQRVSEQAESQGERERESERESVNFKNCRHIRTHTADECF